MIERGWEWRFAASPEELWPVLADTARFNNAIGLPRYAVEETSRADGSVRRTGSARRFGLELSWEEGVPEWVAPRRFAHERRFHSGPLRRVATEITIDPPGDPTGVPPGDTTGVESVAAGSLVRYRLAIEPRFRMVAMLLRLGFIERFGRRLDRLFRAAADDATAGGEPGFRAPPRPLPEAVRQRVAVRAQALAGQGYAAATRLATHLVEAADIDLERMRPRALARQWGAPPRDIIETCLAAAREGLLILRWDLICPRCRGAKIVVTSLDQLPQGAHCPSCNIAFDRDFSLNVEVTFEPADDLRPIAAGTYCLASPMAMEHIKIQQRLDAGGAALIEVELADGDYRARTVEAGGATDFEVREGALPQIVLGDGDPALGPERRLAHLHATNATASYCPRRWPRSRACRRSSTG